MNYGGFTLPKGFRFQPSDEVLLGYYLEKKNQRKDSQITAIIPEIDVCKHEPRDLPALVFTRAEFLDKEWFTMADSPDMEWYFFSPRVYKHSNSKSKSTSPRIERTTKEGSWKKQGHDRRITGACSDKQIGGKRILTFYLPKRQKTDWVIHEYYLTKADSDEQIGDFVLCRLKDNSLKNKSGKSDRDQQGTPFCGGGEPSSGNVEDQASKELGNVLPIPNDIDDEPQHDRGSCSTALNVEIPATKRLEDVLPIPTGHDDNAEHGGGSCHITTGFENGEAGYGMRTEAEEYQAYLLLSDAVLESNEQELEGSQTGPPVSSISPDSEMDEELLDEPGNLVLLNPCPSPPLQSPIYTKRGTTDFPNDECRKRKHPFGDSDPFLTKKNHTDEVDINTSSNSEIQAADAIREEYPQSGENLGYDSFQSQELLSINREQRDLPHDNSLWDDLPSLIEGFDSSLAKFSDIDASNSDRNIKATDGSVNDYSALAILESYSALAILEQDSNIAFIGEYQSRGL